MGEIADLMLDGAICQTCGMELGDACGYPRTCRACGGDNGGIAATPREQDIADYLLAAERHGWTRQTHNNGWHIALHRQGVQLDLWLSTKHGPRWRSHSAKGKAQSVHKGLLQALTQESA